MLLTVFISYPKDTPDTLHSNLERLNLTPVSSEQIARVLLSPFIDQFSSILRYARVHCGVDDDMLFSSFLADVAVRCLEIASKVFFQCLCIMRYLTLVLGQGNMLRSMCEEYPSLEDDIQIAAATKYRLTVGDLPSPEQEKQPFSGQLCRDLYAFDLETAMTTHGFDEDGWDGSPSHGDETGMGQSEGVSTPTSERFLVRRYCTLDNCVC
jgi:hypothetical protein